VRREATQLTIDRLLWPSLKAVRRWCTPSGCKSEGQATQSKRCMVRGAKPVRREATQLSMHRLLWPSLKAVRRFCRRPSDAKQAMHAGGGVARASRGDVTQHRSLWPKAKAMHMASRLRCGNLNSGEGGYDQEASFLGRSLRLSHLQASRKT
jgi:hypothetical protein